MTAAVVATSANAVEVRLAVASNFAEAIERIRPWFEAKTGHRLTLSTGSTGKLYAQIRGGAPFDVLLAADAQTPRRLETDGEGVAASRFTYAFGRLALWSATPGVVGADGAATLRAAQFRHLAIANPDLAPYGAAARDALRALQSWDRLQPKIVYAQNIGHAFAMVASGNAELGLIALSQLNTTGRTAAGSSWVVPAALHEPIRQDAVLLVRGQANAGARAFLEAMKSIEVRAMIESFGYSLE
ncbi:MAG: molybdate ABC transporter substrate-binding protein [Burkholderiaceae bacterium]